MPSADDAELARVCVVVLAAGAGRRLGLGPKAHVVLGGATFLHRVVGVCRAAGLVRIRVVGGPEDAHISSACAAERAELTVNPDPARGMSSSVYEALRAERGEPKRGVLVFPVDFPLVRPATVRAVALAAMAAGDAWARPVFAGRRGHPVGLGEALPPRLLAQGPAVPLREALRELRAHTTDLVGDDPGVVADIDLPADLEAARHAMAARA